MHKMMPAVEDETGYYVHTISVAAAKQGPLYLHLNRENEAAIRFYERNGFKRLAEGSMMHKGHELSQVLMGRREEDDV